jgi:hypothetical protein
VRARRRRSQKGEGQAEFDAGKGMRIDHGFAKEELLDPSKRPWIAEAVIAATPYGSYQPPVSYVITMDPDYKVTPPNPEPEVLPPQPPKSTRDILTCAMALAKEPESGTAVAAGLHLPPLSRVLGNMMPFLPALSDDRTFMLMAQLLAGLGDDDYEEPEFAPLDKRPALKDVTDQEHHVGAHDDDLALPGGAAAGSDKRRRRILQVAVKINDVQLTFLCDTARRTA